MKTTPIWLSSALVLSLFACNGQNLPANLPSALPSNVPALTRPSANPAAPNTSPVATPSQAPTTTPSPGQGEIKVIGSDLFNKYTINYRVGMKWVYSLKMPGLSLPSLPAIPGFTTSQLPGNINDLLNLVSGGSTGSSGSSGSSTGSATSASGELGEMSMEVTAIQGDLVTMATTVKMALSMPGGAPIKPTQTTFSKSNPQKLYDSLAQSGDTNGTYTYSLIGPESVNVAAGSYGADKISGKLQASTSSSAGSTSIQQDSLIWMANNVGMVKQETKTVTAGIASTTVLELKSFTP